ncbi:hypothetical protein QVD17_15800 [Tagetes erecta]|uniref:Uncharacterized protein n=1 Tax=Tagetes erecta TaxID=13708 RepID=A0AAD8KQA8_TARER|nr:hypothetical protein QVD17_15800 [Tagetes erecta]
MKQTDKKRTIANNQTKRSARSQSRDTKQLQEKPRQPSKAKRTDTKAVIEESSQSNKTFDSNQENVDQIHKLNTNLEDESDSETVADSISSSGDSRATEDEKLEPGAIVSQNPTIKDNSENSSHKERVKSSKNISEKTSDNNLRGVKVHPKLSSAPSSVSSEGIDDENAAEPEEVDILDGDETKEDLGQKFEEMEMRIEKLEEELREVAALEISLYSVVPEHGSSAHKVHTPARRLSRLYIHAAKHYSQGKRETIAKNTASGLVLIAKSCGNDVPRLTFWWSNTIVLRETITQAFGSSCQSSSSTRALGTSVSSNKNEGRSKQFNNKPDFIDFIDDWQETRTFTSALEKVESWIFSRIIESIWWQTLTPKMQPLGDDTNANNSIGKLLGPASSNQQQGNFSINLWRIAFHDAFKRLCPVRAGGHDCGCLPALARMVMEQCVARLDVAMFNAILRESALEMPTDPVSDPIVESRVLPIPAGDLSFSSGAQLKNAVGNWSRWLSDWFGMDTEDEHEHDTCEDISEKDGKSGELKCFHLLNALSDLLMLPKDMLMDKSVRTEVCPSISLPLLKRILCNFTPDEFCPDSVPGTVLEAVNAESMIEHSLSGDASSSFPYAAAPVIYKPPSSIDVLSEVGGKQSQLMRNSSVIQRKGYTSDEELEQLDSPLGYIIDKQPYLSLNLGRNENDQQNTHVAVNARYELLREVWLS